MLFFFFNYIFPSLFCNLHEKLHKCKHHLMLIRYQKPLCERKVYPNKQKNPLFNTQVLNSLLNPWQLQKKKPILIIFATCCKFMHLANFEILISKTCYGDFVLTCLSQPIKNSHFILPLFFRHFLEMFCITEQYKPCR